MTQRSSQQIPGTKKGSTQSQTSSKGKSSELTNQLRGMSFEEGASLLSPGKDKGSGMMPAPGLKSRLGNSSYKKVYDLDKKIAKVRGGKRDKLLESLRQRAETYLATHKEGLSDKQDARVKAVRGLLERLTGASKTETPVESKVETKTDTPVESKVETKTETPIENTVETKTEAPSESTVETKTETPSESKVETTGDEKLPNEVTDKNVPQVLGELGLPVVDLTTQQESKGDTKVEVKGEDEKKGEQEKVSESEKPEIPEAPDIKKMGAPNFGTLPVGVTVEQLTDASVQLPASDIAKLSYKQLVHYFDTRDKSHVESLRTEGDVVNRIMSFGSEEMANLVVRVILRTPNSVVDRGGARAEAIRVLSSQLRAKYIAKKLLQGDVIVVIVPKNALMTDLPEFQGSKGKYTFDGRPWDTTRGLGGKSTAITEENLLGTDVESGPSMTRKGWENQQQYDTDKKNNVETNKTKDFKPDVYCSGYSTTNHEFFHTIHMFGLPKSDSGAIERLYKAKKSQPATTEWADGPRLQKDNDTVVMDNYSSATVYEYFAQTGCAYQGTNKGTDPYTGRERNNGRSWVERNEPELASILSRTCQDEELKNVNPRDQKKALENIKSGGVAKAGESRALNGDKPMSPKHFANRARLEKLLTPGKDQPPGVLVDNN